METIITPNITWEDNFGAYCDLLPGCVATHANLVGVKKAFQFSVASHLQGMIEDGIEVPEQFRGEYRFECYLDT